MILVTGATGYIGGRLVPRLLKAGYRVRCLVREPDQLRSRWWEHRVEIVEGNVLKPETLGPALVGVDVAYYLIHSMGAGEEEFAERDRVAAGHFSRAADEAGVSRIIFLGGIRPKSERRSKHLESRLETGATLRRGSVPVTEFRAGVIVGSGSLSFELIRYLTERLPVLITPRWVRTPTQPIAVRNVLEYLVMALETPESAGRVIEIGGKDVLSYGDMFRGYARVRGLRRLIIDVPFLTPRLSSHWVGVVTPINSKIARPLIEGLDNEVVVHDDTAQRLFDLELLSYEDAVRRALDRSFRDDVETTWSGAVSSSGADRSLIKTLDHEEGLIRERAQIHVRARPESVFRVVNSLGGETGWLFGNFLWRIRGLMDTMVGGIGMRKTRRSYSRLRVGDTVDFFRVEAVVEDRLLRLRAEMKVPGRAWLQYDLTSVGDSGCLASQTAFFEPKGLGGLLYWYLLLIPHRFIFYGMMRELRRRAEAIEEMERRIAVGGG